MPDQPGPKPKKELQSEQAAAAGSDRLNVARSGQPRAWGHDDRNRLLIFVGIAFILPVPFILLLHPWSSQSVPVFTVQSELPTKALTALSVLLATWVVSRIEERPLDDYGAPPAEAFGRRFWEGAVWGFAMLSAILLGLHMLGRFQINSVALAGEAVFRFALGWAAVFLAVSLTEEFCFRGYLLFILSRRQSFWPAAVLLSVAFGAAHLANHGENALGILHIVATGLLFCLTIRRTGNLWFAVGYHAAWDWAETFFYGTPDSGILGSGRYLNTSVQGPDWLTGGLVGPEGSVIALCALAICAMLIHWRFPKAIYPDRPG